MDLQTCPVSVTRAGIVACLLLVVSHGTQADVALTVPAGQRQLFLDDVGIAKMENLKRTMHRPAKKGAVIRPDGSKGGGCLQVRTAPFWVPEAKVFRFMVGETASDPSTFRWFNSTDGLHWTPGDRPKMGMYIVVYDARDPDPSQRYKTIVWNRGVAVSPDGIDWSMAPGVPGIPSGDEYNLSLDERNRQFILTVKRGGPYGRSVAVVTSEDFRNWNDYGVVFHADKLDQELGRKHIESCYADPARHHPWINNPAQYNVDVYNMGVFRYESVYIGLPNMFHKTGVYPKDWPGFETMELSEQVRKLVRQTGDYVGFHHVQLACSRDLKSWKRLGKRRPFIDLSPLGVGAYDLSSIRPPSNAVVRGDELWFYYTGMKYYELLLVEEPDRGAICLAVLRRDGFVSLDAGKAKGSLVTKPFAVPGGKLFVNVNALGGELRVEMMDNDGRLLARSKPLSGNLLREEVQWQQGDIADFKGHRAALRFTLRNGQLYSFWFE